MLGIQLGIQELVALSYPTHLIKVNNRYYYKIKVPADLSHLFPSRFIKKSLITEQLNAPSLAVVPLSDFSDDYLSLSFAFLYRVLFASGLFGDCFVEVHGYFVNINHIVTIVISFTF